MTKLVVVAAEFNEALIARMIEAAADQAESLGAKIVETVKVPGCYEIPLVAAMQIKRLEVDALVVIGFIEKGETMHGEVMGHVVHRCLVDLELQHRKPIGIGIIGPGASPEQAQARWDGYARAAVSAAVRISRLIE